jgi:hypothetical protein
VQQGHVSRNPARSAGDETYHSNAIRPSSKSGVVHIMTSNLHGLDNGIVITLLSAMFQVQILLSASSDPSRGSASSRSRAALFQGFGDFLKQWQRR